MSGPKIDHERAERYAKRRGDMEHDGDIDNLARAYIGLAERHRKLVLESRELVEHCEHGLSLHDAVAKMRFRAALAAEDAQ